MPNAEPLSAELTTAERNHFFFGKLLTVDDFRREQSYFLSRRWLLNRLLHGYGTVAGLAVARDPADEALVRIEAGIALDGAGREIVIPEPVSIDPSQLTDESGEPVGDPLAAGTVEICVGYRERRIDPVPVLVADCDNPGMCDHTTVQESFRLVVREAVGDPPAPVSCDLGPFAADPAELHARLAERLTAPLADLPADLCVPLARVVLPLDDDSVDSISARPLVAGNALLHELASCLLEELGEQLAAETLLVYFSGDGQSAPSATELESPLVVRVVDRDLEPVRDVLVQFGVAAGGGDLSRTEVRTTTTGRASTRWTLGPGTGRQAVVARAVGTALSVRFRARVTT